MRVIVHNFIVEEHTKMVIYEAYRTSTFPRSGPNVYQEYTESDNGFFAFLGSVLGSSTMRLLLDHKADIGYRTVERVVVFAEDSEEDEYDQARSIMIMLSACGEPNTRPATTGLAQGFAWLQTQLQHLIQIFHSE